MNRFHSSGTPSGNVEVMWTWKMIIPITASVPSVPSLVENSRISGSANSIAVPRCAAKRRLARRAAGRPGWSA